MRKIKFPLFALLSELKQTTNSHLRGTKSVFLANNDTSSMLTQLAHGVMQKGEESGLHSHHTMDEYFYFIAGNGLFCIGEESFKIKPASFIRVPAGAIHNLSNDFDYPLEFIYFGIAL